VRVCDEGKKCFCDSAESTSDTVLKCQTIDMRFFRKLTERAKERKGKNVDTIVAYFWYTSMYTLWIKKPLTAEAGAVLSAKQVLLS